MKASIEFADYLKQKRVEAGLSQRQVANFFGYTSAQFISNWERAIILPPADTLAALMRLYKISEDEFLNKLMEYSESFWKETLSFKKTSKHRKSV